MSVSMPMATISLLLGMCGALFMQVLPTNTWAVFAVLLAATMLKFKHSVFTSIVGMALLGFALLVFRVNLHSTHALPTQLEGQTLTVIGTISSVVENYKKPNSKFIFQLKSVENTLGGWLPATIQLSWQQAPLLQPGETWQLQVKIKRPRNYANPGSFDSERYFFMQRIVGTGYVVDNARNKQLASNVLYAPGNYLRQTLYAFMQQHLNNQELLPILSALCLNIRNISTEHYRVLMATGTAHLLAISGLHMGIVASTCMLILKLLGHQIRLPLNKSRVAAGITLVICILYAYLVGLSIATQRAIIMLTTFLSGIIFKRYIPAWQSYYLALGIILVYDPLAILSYGFWFSFAAVGLLLYAAKWRKKPVNLRAKALLFLRPQLILTLSLIPLSFFCFAKVSLIGPIANIVAIPWVSLTILPLCLCALLLVPISNILSIGLFKLAAKSLTLLWIVLKYLAQVPIYSWTVPNHYLILTVIAGIGCLWLLAPSGIPGRIFGLCGLLPLLVLRPVTITPGIAHCTLLDVGQGLACVIRTKNHVLVYDTGARLTPEFDLGAQVVVPYLQHVGVKKIDLVLLSHGDNDHIGGFASLAQRFPIEQVIASEEGMVAHGAVLCVAGQNWEWDGVKFSILHPALNSVYKKRNDRSCVLMVEAQSQKILLTGDIEARSEKELIARYGGALQADILLVPHHGSKTSSSLEFIKAVQPKYALIPAGYKNRYQHPRPEVLQRYSDHNIQTLSTITSGALSINLGASRIPTAYRPRVARFWSVH